MAEQLEAEPSPAVPPGRNRKLQVAGLALVGIGLCLQFPYLLERASSDLCTYPSHDNDFFLQILILGIGLGVVGVLCILRARELCVRAFAPLITVVIIAEALFVVAIPNFLHYSRKSPQTEARIHLGGIYVAEMAFYQEHKRFGTLEEIGFTIPGTNRYTYRINPSGSAGTVIPPRRGGRTETHRGPIEEPLTICPPTLDNTVVPAGLSATSFTATATGNIDDDPTLDQWHVNDAKCCLNQPDVNDITN